MTAPTVAVIIVNYATAELAAEAVESVRAHAGDSPGLSIHVVDNASPGEDGARLMDWHRSRSWGPQVTIANVVALDITFEVYTTGDPYPCPYPCPGHLSIRREDPDRGTGATGRPT